MDKKTIKQAIKELKEESLDKDRKRLAVISDTIFKVFGFAWVMGITFFCLAGYTLGLASFVYFSKSYHFGSIATFFMSAWLGFQLVTMIAFLIFSHLSKKRVHK